MRKFYYLMFIAFAFFSCKKFESVNITSEKEFLLTEFRSQFKKDSILFYQKFDRTNYSYRQSLTRIIYWEQAKQVKDTIVIPVSLQLPNGAIDIKTGKNTLNHKVYLTISKDKNDRYTYEMITFIGNGSIAKNKFVGTILREGFFEGNIKYTSYYKGKVYKHENSNLQLNKYNLLASRGDETDNCYWVLTVIAYVEGYPNDYHYERVCERSDVYPEITDEVDDSSGGGGGGGDTNPGISDCAGILNGTAYIGECGKCIGGTTGINSCLDLIDSLQNYPCAQSLLTKLPNLKNTIATLIKSQFVGNDDFNITFRAKKLDSLIDGLYNPNSNNMYNSTVTLNTDILLNSSKEYILVTMYHEALHSFLNLEEQKLSRTEFTIKYPNLSRIDNNQVPRYYFNHDGFPSFINKLADAIISFNPKIPYSDAIILSKTGIVTNMTNEEKLINQSYRNGTKGQKCN